MSIVADFSVSAEAFCLSETLQNVPTATVELERLVADNSDYVMPFIWLIDGVQEDFDAALAADPTVRDATVTDSFDDTFLYQVSWADTVSERLNIILDHDGVILEARGGDDEWRLWVRLGSRSHFTEFRDHFDEFGEISLHTIMSQNTPGGIQYGVSEKQREALLAANDMGYYDVPSTGSGEKLAERLGISQQAVSNRLRRGMSTLIENTLGRHRE